MMIMDHNNRIAVGLLRLLRVQCRESCEIVSTSVANSKAQLHHISAKGVELKREISQRLQRHREEWSQRFRVNSGEGSGGHHALQEEGARKSLGGPPSAQAGADAVAV